MNMDDTETFLSATPAMDGSQPLSPKESSASVGAPDNKLPYAVRFILGNEICER